MQLDTLYQKYKEQTISGRYITLDHIESLLQKCSSTGDLKIVGNSVLGKPIYKYSIGTGKIRIFMWSQMHGNESTTTKALFDFFNFLNSNDPLSADFLLKYTFCFLPMVNPDGAKLYTRENANKIDLNRDSVNLSQPESKILRAVFEDFKPDFCYNLHDQRTIFGIENSNKPATVSFLAPSYNESKEYNETRLKAVNVIVAMNLELQKYILGQVGRFDDGFNINCIGDMFQSLNVPTILFEAGHFPDDYQREKTREMIFISVVTSLHYIHENDIVGNEKTEYLQIPQNKVIFYDIFYKNVKINYDCKEKITNFALQFKEEVLDGKVIFVAYIAQIDNLDGYCSHYEYDAENKLYSDNEDNNPKINQIANFSLDNVKHFVNGLKKV